MSTSTIRDKAEEFRAAYMAGKSYRDIAREHDVSYERVRQVVLEVADPEDVRAVYDRKVAEAKAERDAQRAERRMERRYGVSTITTDGRAPESVVAAIRAHAERESDRSDFIPTEIHLAAMMRFMADPHEVSGSVQAYDTWRRSQADSETLPAGISIIQRFGKWSHAKLYALVQLGKVEVQPGV